MLEYLLKQADKVYVEPCLMIQKEGKWFTLELLCCGLSAFKVKSIKMDTLLCRAVKQIVKDPLWKPDDEYI